MFHDAETREHVLWHSRNQEYRDQNVMSHPSHGSEWKSFNHKHKKVAADPRNIRLGLASDGFNPFATIAPHIACGQCVLSLTTCLQMSAPKNQTT